MPSEQPPQQITQLIQQASEGQSTAASRLFELVYAELRGLAGGYMKREGGAAGAAAHTLQPTALVHEVFIKLVGAPGGVKPMQGRAHFFATAAKAMRQILIDHARTARRGKRGGDWSRITLDEAVALATGDQFDILDLDEALGELSSLNERQGRLVELRFFGGLSIEEAAEALEVSPATAKTDWRMARAWLSARLSPPSPNGAAGQA